MAEVKKYREFIFSSQDKINGVGSRVMSAGIDVEQFMHNPVLLYMHQRFGKEDMPIGRVEDIRLIGDKWIGRPVFDQDDPYAMRIALKWEKEFLRMCSPNLEIIETSTEPTLMLPGQCRPTITRSKLTEISIADIGANDDHLQLSYQGNVLKLAQGEASEALPLISETPSEPISDSQIKNNMNEDLKPIALAMGLAEGATSAQIISAIALMKGKADQVDNLQLAAINKAVEVADQRLKLTADQKTNLVSIGRAAGVDALDSAIALMKPSVKPTDVLNAGVEDKSLALKFEDMTSEQLLDLRTNNRDKYIALYKEKYGSAPSIEA